jgi:hypothetical protein
MAGKSDGVKETPQQAAMVQRATAEMADYKARWLPLQQRMAQQVQDLAADDSSDRKLAKGRAAVEAQAKFGQAQGAVEKSLSNSGRGPGSAAFGLGVTGLASDLAASKGAGMAAADAAIDDAYVAGLGALTAIGRGEKAEALKGQSQLAAMSGRQAAADAEAAAEARAGNMQLAGTVAGYGLSSAMQPAASNVPQAALNRANATRDPLGSLNAQMGWTN